MVARDLIPFTGSWYLRPIVMEEMSGCELLLPGDKSAHLRPQGDVNAEMWIISPPRDVSH